jgi:hypothetical protein
MTEVLHNEPIKSEPYNVIYSSYTESQKKATLKYREKNRDKVNEQRKIYYKQRKENDPQFLEYKRAKSREYYQRKKHEKENNNSEIELSENIVKIDEPIKEEIVAVELPVLEETEVKIEKPKRVKKVKIPELEPQPEVLKSELIEFDKKPEDENVVSTILATAIVKKNNRKKSKVVYDV